MRGAGVLYVVLAALGGILGAFGAAVLGHGLGSVALAYWLGGLGGFAVGVLLVALAGRRRHRGLSFIRQRHS